MPKGANISILEFSTVYSADRAMSALEAALLDIEAARSASPTNLATSHDVDVLGDVSHSIQVRLIEGFEALAAQPADPWTRFDQLMRAADLFGRDAPIVGLIAAAIPADQARLASVEAA